MVMNAPKGTKDVLPSQVHKWQYVERVFQDICETYGFKEIRTPVFEHTELFARGVGDTTDIVEKQMYTFSDYANRSITLKPEGTASAVRAFVEHKVYAEVQPTKLYYVIPCFRYEKPQSGRLREFHQFGIETFGTDNMMADAEIIALGADLLDRLRIQDVELRINSVGCPKCREGHRTALRAFLSEKFDALCDTCKGRYERNPLRILDCKSPVCGQLTAGAPVMLDYLCAECDGAFADLRSGLAAMEIDYTVDAGIVRGLDYYTKTAFEFVSGKIGAQGTVIGGGRYDHLIEQLGGPPIPGVGFALGIERLLMVMEASGSEIPAEEGADVFIAVMGENARTFGLALTRKLRRLGFKTEIDVLCRNIKGQFKYADRLNAAYTAVIGEDELAAGKVTLKNMRTSGQALVGVDDLIAELQKRGEKNEHL